MLQLCYASTRIEAEQDLLADLSDILAVARKFNLSQQIVGVLYYAEGYFFQCLEGDAKLLNALFQKISQDPRHHNVFRFPDREIETSHFQAWSMKYVHKHSEIANLFHTLGLENFQPHQLESQHLAKFLKILYSVDENHKQLVSSQGYKKRGYLPYF